MRSLAALVLVATLVIAAPAAAQTQVDVQAAFEPAVPQVPVGLELTADLRGPAAGSLPQTTRAIALALPTGFRYTGSGGPRCTADSLRADGPDRCPAGSRLGTATIRYTYVAAGLRFPGTTRRVELHDAGDGKLAVFVATRDPVDFSIVLEGAVTEGPTLQLDLEPVASFSGGAVVIERLELDLPRSGAGPAPPPAARAPRAPKVVPTRCVRRSARTLNCSKARCPRRGPCVTTLCSGAAGRRTCRPLRCVRDLLKPNYATYRWQCRGVPKDKGAARGRTAQVPTSPAPSAVVSGPCPAGGSWTLEARFTFKGDDRTVARRVAIPCAVDTSSKAPAPSPVPVAPPAVCAVLPVCPPS